MRDKDSGSNNSNIGLAVRLWGRTILSTIMCIILYVSMSVLGNGLIAREVGYRILGTGEDGGTVVVEEYRYQPGESLQSLGVTADEGQQISKIKEMTPGAQRGLDIVTGIMMLILHGMFPYGLLWERGSRDDNNVHFGHAPEDLWRGVRIGALTAIPAAATYLFLLVDKAAGLTKWYLPVYRFISMPFLPFINLVLSDSTAGLGQLAWWRILLLAVTLLFVPAIAGVGYLLGYRQISIHERLTYKKTAQSKPARKPRDHEI